MLAIASNALAGTCWRGTLCSDVTEAAFPGPWDQNIFAPSTRTISPVNIVSLSDGSMTSAYPGKMSLNANASALVFDFGVEVGGILSIGYSTTGGQGSMEIGRAHV